MPMSRSNRGRKTSFRMPGAEVMGAKPITTNLVRFRVLRYHSTTGISMENFVSESDKFFTRHSGARVIKEGNDYAYFPSWEAARDFTLSLAEHELRNAKHNVETIKALKPGVRDTL